MLHSDWNPPIELSELEERIVELCKKQKLWGFLRRHRHILIDEEVRADLRAMYATGSKRAATPVAPERLALAMLLQVAFRVPDHEVPTLTAVDRRWQMVLDCMGEEEPVLSQGTVFAFRERARMHGFMDRFLQKTVTLARKSRGYSAPRLRALIDSSPLLGAGRVEDTFNLLGRAIAKLVEVAAEQAGRKSDEVADELALSVVAASSVKAALDLDWREASARSDALRELLGQFDRLSSWLQKQFTEKELARPPLGDALDIVNRIIEQNTVPDPNAPGPGPGTTEPETAETAETIGAVPERILRQGTVKDRLISLSDPDMRHGCKSKTKKFNGYKRHIAVDADIPGLILDAEVLSANRREHEATAPLVTRLENRGFELDELHIDRGYLAASIVHVLRDRGTEVITKPPAPVRGERFSKYDFDFAPDSQTLTCPQGKTIPYRGDGKTHRFPAPVCRECQIRKRCIPTSNKYGKTLKMHEYETYFREMHADLANPTGRARRRARIPVEHALARVGQIQTTRARFRGLAKNQFDLIRTAVVANLHVLAQGLQAVA